MSLADELLADLEEGGEEVEPTEQEVQDGIEDVEDVAMDTDQKGDLHSVAKLRDSDQLKEIMTQIEYYRKSKEKKVSGPLEADPEYQLIVEANNTTVEIDNEINVIHKFVRDLYYKRFPELESLVPLPLQYMKTVKELGNTIDKPKSNSLLNEILTSATIMVVSVTASTTQGQELDKEELERVFEACDMAIDLIQVKQNIHSYVESRMSFIAPNLSIIVGSSTAAKLMGCAGGIANLSKMPACNVLVLGAQKKTLSGFSTTAILPHTGFIYHCEMVQKLPTDLRRKVARLVAAKCTLAARVDSFHESQDGKVGDDLLEIIEHKLDKMQEPPPVKAIKPLPAPIDPGRKKRGGRRYRKMKERLGMTDMRKFANRMNFAAIEDDAYQDDLGFSLGNLTKSASGRIRGPIIDSKTKAKISKTLQQKMVKSQVWGGSTTVKKQVAGTASSVAFTPLQGLEIVNPQAAEMHVRESNNKYFSTTGGFINVAAKKDA